MAHNDRQGQWEADGVVRDSSYRGGPEMEYDCKMLTYQHWNPGHVVGSARNRLSGEIASRLWLRSAGQVPRRPLWWVLSLRGGILARSQAAEGLSHVRRWRPGWASG